MGAAESRSLTSTSSDSSIRGRIGFHVLRVADGSPAADAGIQPFFDYVVGVGGTALTADMAKGQGGAFVEEMLARLVEEHEGQPLSLQVWSSKHAELRELEVVPSRDWSSGTRQNRINSTYSDQDVSLGEESQPSLLGLSLRLCNPDGALEKVWHVLEILEGSPAESAGLVPFGDYILGYAGGVLHKEADFYKLVEEHVDTPLRLFVYNADFDVTREVVIVPNRAWSQGAGEGLLGCGVGYGVLHRIPRPQPGASTSSSSTTNGSPVVLPQQHASPMTQPKRMTASVVPTSPPQAASNTKAFPQSLGQGQGQGWKNATQSNINRQGYGLNAPPRSPSATSLRSSVAEVIAEEDE